MAVKRSRPALKKKSKLSDALRELRRRLELSQTAMSQKLGVTLLTVQHWETQRAPGGIILARLIHIAKKEKHADLADIFEAGIQEEARPVREGIEEERKLWDTIDQRVDDILRLAYELIDEKHPAA